MASSSVFLDANGLIALLNRADTLHPNAASVWQELLDQRRSFVVTDWIIAETGNGMSRTNGRRPTAEFLLGLTSSRSCEVVFVGEGLLDESLTRYRDRPDKLWGLVDCCSMVVMQKRGLTEVFTADHHFQQAGFTCLLRIDGE